MGGSGPVCDMNAGRYVPIGDLTSGHAGVIARDDTQRVQVTLGQMSEPMEAPVAPTFSTFTTARSRPCSLERRSHSRQASFERRSHSSRSHSRGSHHSSSLSSQAFSAATYNPGDPAALYTTVDSGGFYAAAPSATILDPYDDPAIDVDIGQPGERRTSSRPVSRATSIVNYQQLASMRAEQLAAASAASAAASRNGHYKEPSSQALERRACTDHGYTADDEYEERTVKQLLKSLQKQVSLMSRNLSAKLDSIQAERHLEANDQLYVIRCQLKQLTRSVDTYQHEVTEVRKNVHDIRHEIDQLQHAKDEIEELRNYVERLDFQRKHRYTKKNKHGLTCYLAAAIFSAVLGMFQFGYNTGVINAPQEIIEKFIRQVWRARYQGDIDTMTLHLIWSGAVSIFAIGGMIGGFSGAYIANRFGRKGGMLLNDGVGIIGAGLMAMSQFAQSFELLIVGRMVIGYNCGLSTSLVPMYVSEIAPVGLRGGVGIANQLAVTVGMLLSQVLGLNQLLGTERGWPFLLGLAVCPAVLQLVLLPMCPESPRYLLITKQQEQQARKALRQLRHRSDIEDDVEEMKLEDRAQHTESRITMWQLVRSSSLRHPLIIAIIMQLSQQLSGINAVFYYSTDIFQDAHLSVDNAKYATMGVGVVMVLMTMVSILLIEREGRRTLHLWGLGGMFFFSVFITISFLVKQMINWIAFLAVISTFGFVIFFAVGPGSIPWMITAELFSQGPRPAAMSIAVLINWLCNFVVGIAFLPLKGLLEDYTFLPFSILLAVFWVFTYNRVPETKGKTFEEISAIFRPSRSLQSGSEPILDEQTYGSTMNCLNSVEYADTRPVGMYPSSTDYVTNRVQLPPPPPPERRTHSPFDRSDSEPLVCTMSSRPHSRLHSRPLSRPHSRVHSMSSSRPSLHASLERSHGAASSAASVRSAVGCGGAQVRGGTLTPRLLDRRSCERLQQLQRRSSELA